MPSKSTRKSSSRSRSSSSSRKSTSRAEAEKQASRQLWAIVVFAAAILFAAITLFKGQKVWLWVHNFVLGMFGWSAYLISPIFFYIAIMATLDKPLGAVKHKVWQTFVLIGLLSGATQIFGRGALSAADPLDLLALLFEQGTYLKGGGVMSAIFGLPLIHFLGLVGAKITIILLIFVFLMILTGTTLIGLYRSASAPVRMMGEAYAEKQVQRFEQKQQRFNIDVPLENEPDYSAPEITDGRQRTRRAKKALLDISDEPETSSEMSDLLETEPEAETSTPLITETEPEFPTDPEETFHLEFKKFDEILETEEIPSPDAEEFSPLIDDLVGRMSGSSTVQSSPEQQEPFERLEEGLAASIQSEQEVYQLPSLDLLNPPPPPKKDNLTEEKAKAEKLIETLGSFGVQATLLNITRGPAVTRYELQPAAGVKVSKITGLADDIALNLAASGVRIEAPIPNKPAVGIEIPNREVSAVSIREILDTADFRDTESKLTVALGKDITGSAAITDLAKMPHTLIAGSTGSGKSVCINSLIISILYKAKPDEVKLLMVDPKMVELGIYNGIPHLLVPVVTDPKKAAGALGWAVTEMLDRYQKFKDNSVRDIKGYNKMAASKQLPFMPQMVIIIDELADLMIAAPNEVEDSICRLAQMARAAGMHLVIATQRPSVDVITGVIKANIPSRIAFAVSSQVDSRTILDSAGAEKLLGRGDMLFQPVGASKPMRIQGCFVTDEEVEQVVESIKQTAQNCEYSQEIIEEIDRHAVVERGKKGGKESSPSTGFDQEDEMFPSAVECVIEAGQCSTSLLQRKLKLGYARAARIVDAMEERGVVGPPDGSKPRTVLINRERWLAMKNGAAQRAREEWGD